MNKTERLNSYEVRELLHESLRAYVSEVLTHGHQSETTETLVGKAFSSLLESSSINDIEWAIKRLSRAVGALDEEHYTTIHAHQENFEKMIQGLKMQKSIAAMVGRAYGG